jgi:hypothetical protein
MLACASCGNNVRSGRVALGTNDSGTSTAHIDEDYTELVDDSPNILLAGLPPLEMGRRVSRPVLRKGCRGPKHAAIRSLAADRFLTYIDLRKAMQGDGLTVDGVHLTAAAYS